MFELFIVVLCVLWVICFSALILWWVTGKHYLWRR
jgi:hypothetical protein